MAVSRLSFSDSTSFFGMTKIPPAGINRPENLVSNFDLFKLRNISYVCTKRTIYEAVELDCDIETIWDATLDGRTRPAHGVLDGKPKDDPEKGWNVPEIGWVSAPLYSGITSFDINCRCRIRDQVKGYPPTERYVRGDGIQPYQICDK